MSPVCSILVIDPTSPDRVTFVDESVHDEPGLYVLAAVVVRECLRGDVERALRSLVPRRRRPHWRHEDAAARAELVAAVAKFDVEIRAYGCRFAIRSRKEAARSRALEWLVGDLDPADGLLVLDSRTGNQDGLDRRLLRRLAGQPPRFSYEHRRSGEEPLLWLPDVAAGAVAARWVRKTGLAELESRLLVCECEP